MPGIIDGPVSPSVQRTYRYWPSQVECWLKILADRTQSCTAHNHRTSTISFTTVTPSATDANSIVLKGYIIAPGDPTNIESFKDTLPYNDQETVFVWEEAGLKSAFITCPPDAENPVCSALLHTTGEAVGEASGQVEAVQWRVKGAGGDFELSLTVAP